MADKPLAKRGGRIAFQNAMEIYDKLAEHAKMTPAIELQEYGYPAREGEEILVFEGYVTKIAATELNLLPSSITHATATLKAMNAVTLLIMGNKIRKSIYLLHYRPTMEQYEDFMGNSYAIERKTIPNRYDSLINDLVVIRQRLDVVERELAELRGNQHG